MRIFADCPKCQSNLTYKDGGHFVCAECTHEWPLEGATATEVNVSTLPARSSSKTIINALKDGARSPWQGKKSATRKHQAQTYR
ncbi:MAG TPA: hypothetical protein VF050_07610 [Moraxellaceae bacterium]